MTFVAEGPLTVRALTDLDALRALRTAWQTLFSRSASGNPFLTWEWVVACCEHWRDNPSPLVLVVERTGELAGVLPLVALGAGAFAESGPPRALRFATPSHVDHYAEALCAPGDERAVLQACLRWLADRRQRWRSLELCRAPEGAILRELRDPAVISRLAHVTERFIPPSWRITLPDSWDVLMKRSGNLKRTNEYLRRCVRETGARLERFEDPPAMAAGLPLLFELHAKRWEGRDEPTVFLASRAFWDEVGPRLAESGLLKLFVLRAGDGSPMAAYLVCCCGDRMLGMQTGFDPQWQKYRVGSVALAFVMQFAIAHGYRLFDFTGGDLEYKRHWADHTLGKTTVCLYPRTAAGWLAANRERWRERSSRLAFQLADYERRRRIKRWLLGVLGQGPAAASAPALGAEGHQDGRIGNSHK